MNVGEQPSIRRQVRPASNDSSPPGTRFTAAVPASGHATDSGHMSPSPEVSRRAQERWERRRGRGAA